MTGPLGQGGMAAVDAAVDRRDGRRVALKRLDQSLLRDPSCIDLFETEGRILGRLELDGVPRLHGAGQADGQPYIAMQRVEGQPLGDYCAGRALHWTDIARIGGKAALLIDGVHRAGFVHRDVTPDNLLVGAGEQVWLIDFGVGSAVGRVSSADALGVIHGTLGYLAPERFTELPYTNQPPGDVFALGVVLYELLAGQAPFEGGGPTEVVARTLQGDPPPLEHLRPELGSLCGVVHRALDEDPLHRPTAGELAGLLFAAAGRARRRPAGWRSRTPGAAAARWTCAPPARDAGRGARAKRLAYLGARYRTLLR